MGIVAMLLHILKHWKRTERPMFKKWINTGGSTIIGTLNKNGKYPHFFLYVFFLSTRNTRFYYLSD